MTLSTALGLRVWGINPVFTYIQTCFLKAHTLNAKNDPLGEIEASWLNAKTAKHHYSHVLS